MNKNFTPYIYILFFNFFVCSFYGQEHNRYVLVLKSKDSLENNILRNIDYKSNFQEINQLTGAKDSLLATLKEKGYYTLLIDSAYQQQKNYTYYIKLGNRIKNTYLKIKKEDNEIISAFNLELKKGHLILEIEKLKPFLNTLSNYLIIKGQLFSKVRLLNSTIKNESLFVRSNIC